MKNSYLGHSLFNDVFNTSLQAFNRAVVMKNIREAVGVSAAREYSERITHIGQMKMAIIFAAVKLSSWEQVGKEIRLEAT